MCGLTGFFTVNNQDSRSAIHARARKMAASLTHRGPDSGDIWIDEEAGLALAHRRLAILDLTDEGAQPKASACGRYMIIYNGEIYNHLALRADLEENGAVFRGRSDTETFLEAVKIWGLNHAVQKIAGMFAFVLWDRKERVLHFVRDRMGKKPLYIGWAGGALVFGSELKAIHAFEGFSPRIDADSLALYLRFLCVPAPRTIFENIFHLPPGHKMSLDLGALQEGEALVTKMHAYWSAPEKQALAAGQMAGGDEKTITDEFERRLQQSVEERMISDVPLGAFLSGGIDSSCVAAMMQNAAGGGVKTYSIGFDEGGYNEAAHAKEIAAHLGTDHHEHYCSARDALEVIPKLPDMYDEPFADQSAIPTYLVSKFARGDVTVALSGDGGDELLGGYTRHVQGPGLWKKLRYLPAPFKAVGAAALSHAAGRERGSAQRAGHLRKASEVLKSRDHEALYCALVSQCGRPLVAGTRGLAMPELPALEGAPLSEKLRLWDALFYLPSDVLTKVDRASMAVSLEVRAPLLDHRLFEYVWSLPEEMKVRGGRGKYLLRKVLARHVPEALFERPKQGFNIPLAEWLRGELREWVEALLSEEALDAHGLLDTRAVRKMWAQHLSGSSAHANALWAVLMFQAWYQRWM